LANKEARGSSKCGLIIILKKIHKEDGFLRPMYMSGACASVYIA